MTSQSLLIRDDKKTNAKKLTQDDAKKDDKKDEKKDEKKDDKKKETIEELKVHLADPKEVEQIKKKVT